LCSSQAKNPEPQPELALSMGTDATDRGDNQAAQDMLKKLPGVNAHNIYSLCKNVPSLAALSQKSLKDISGLIGEVNAKKLYSFLHCSATEHLPAG
jgi:ERCC4-type nuclease